MDLSIAIQVFLVAALVLFRAGDLFVTGAVGLSVRLNMPKILVGIVIVGFSTTMPELLVSLQAAIAGKPEIALGNAIGSVIADDALALALAAIIAPILLHQKKTFRIAALFLIVVDFVAYFLAFDGTLNRPEGIILVTGLFLYIGYAIYSAKKGQALIPAEKIETEEEMVGWGAITWSFLAGFIGVLVASNLIVESGTVIATAIGVPEIVIGLTIIALGTSLPEIATVIAAARKGEGEVAAGNIIGADILNILWIAGMSAIVNPIVVDPKIINFSFPAMIAVVGTMLIFLRTKWRLDKWEGYVLLGMYVAYMVALGLLFGFEGQLENHGL